MANVICKIWLFWSEEWSSQLIANEIQHVTLKLYNSVLQKEVLLIAVYANCDAIKRQDLWDYVGQIVVNHQLPWIVGRDFNVVLSEEEKQGGLLVRNRNNRFCSICEYVSFSGVEIYREVAHLIRNGSDHAPLHIVCDSNEEVIIKPFRFLNFLTKHHSFMEIVKDNWEIEFAANPFVELQEKMKKVKKALASWSKETYGNIFQQIATLEDVIKVKELQLEVNPTGVNREQLHKAQVDLNRYLSIEKEYWK
ncbi:uncharacterized protein LOC132048840 [Lycium ferocissimum]|uniref:uncharacterized protein LOC132048840 n=1 Tax=Lycium ferocissimum TaxID=112874 RepID=UPI002814A7DD|nr:uncharacterized protein LOC132048840 [Lycium ferocissimum]